MSFYTNLKLYRPGEPPLVRGVDIAPFVRQMHALRALSGEGSFALKVKYGEAVDQDDAGEPEYEAWDIEERPTSVEDLASGLERLEGTVYRAYIGLGSAPREVFEGLRRPPSPENEVELLLSDWSMQIGPVELADLKSEEVIRSGWMQVGIHGYGYLYPWTFQYLITKAQSLPEIGGVVELCRKSWPVDPEPPDRKEKRIRKRLGRLWPYDLGRIQDWAWGLDENG
jgi:hypothetical protein